MSGMIGSISREDLTMSTSERSAARGRTRPDIYKAIAPYANSDRRKAVQQLIETFIPYGVLWALMVISMNQGYSYWITLVLIVLAAGFQVRIFILFHDSGHGSFFNSARANRILGYISGILTFTPFEQWTSSHARHHASVGDLDRRGMGDVWTMTVEEFQAASWWQRFSYRVYRHPVLMFGFGPGIVFLIGNRFVHKGTDARGRKSVRITNAVLLLILAVAHFTIGLKAYLFIQVPIMLIAGATGVWLFYVQHQYEGVYWARHEEWEPLRAALEGSSYYKLPRVFQWITGSIGLHHIHHVQPRIPNYHLQPCQDNVEVFQQVEPITLRTSLWSLSHHLWDEKRGQLVGFRQYKTGVGHPR
jgi:omega-6 fatty acid desaturase (delta-12 desaturase)